MFGSGGCLPEETRRRIKRKMVRIVGGSYAAWIAMLLLWVPSVIAVFLYFGWTTDTYPAYRPPPSCSASTTRPAVTMVFSLPLGMMRRSTNPGYAPCLGRLIERVLIAFGRRAARPSVPEAALGLQALHLLLLAWYGSPIAKLWCSMTRST